MMIAKSIIRTYWILFSLLKAGKLRACFKIFWIVFDFHTSLIIIYLKYPIRFLYYLVKEIKLRKEKQ